MVSNNLNALFDTVVNVPSSAVTCNAGAGNFFITQLGNHYVSRWINAGCAGAGTFVNSGRFSRSVAALKLNGSALIRVATVPTAFSLFKNTETAVTCGISPIQADMAIA